MVYYPKIVGRSVDPMNPPGYTDGEKRCPTCNRKLHNGTNTERLKNLLAVIHRDGGHYVLNHGLEKACKDAETKVSYLIHEKREPTKEELLMGEKDERDYIR